MGNLWNTNIVPIGASHLQATRAGPAHTIRLPVAYNVAEGMTSPPMASTDTLVPFHDIWFREVIP
jgi:hypothetical protein